MLKIYSDYFCESCGKKVRPGQILCSDCQHIDETENDRIKEEEDYVETTD